MVNCDFSSQKKNSPTIVREMIRQINYLTPSSSLLREKNDHFDNLYEKAKLYKETFIEIVFDHVVYVADDEDQDWLDQYGLIEDNNGFAVVTNNIYKARFVKTFFIFQRSQCIEISGIGISASGLPCHLRYQDQPGTRV